jgi:hypothetical protein
MRLASKRNDAPQSRRLGDRATSSARRRGHSLDSHPMRRMRRWIPLAILLILLILGSVAVVLSKWLAPKPQGHWTDHLSSAITDIAMLVVLLVGGGLAWRHLGQRLLKSFAIVALAVVTTGLVVQVIGNLRVAHSIWRTPYGAEEVSRIGISLIGFESGHVLQANGDLAVLVGGVAFAAVLGFLRQVGRGASLSGAVLSMFPPPFIIPACGVVFLLAWLLRPSYERPKRTTAAPSGRQPR